MDADTAYASMIILIIARGGGGTTKWENGKTAQKTHAFCTPSEDRVKPFTPLI